MEERFRIDGPRFEITRGTKDYPDAFEAVPEPPERLYVMATPLRLMKALRSSGRARRRLMG